MGNFFCCVVVFVLSSFFFGIPINLFPHFSSAEIDASRSESSYQTSKGLLETSVSVGMRFLAKTWIAPEGHEYAMCTLAEAPYVYFDCGPLTYAGRASSSSYFLRYCASYSVFFPYLAPLASCCLICTVSYGRVSKTLISESVRKR